MKNINNFIQRLSSIRKSNGTTNLYYGNSNESEIRRNNLKVYLTKMKELHPKILILGEAAGYKGSRLSGIAFTSEKVLFENPFFEKDSNQYINEKRELESEISATIVWSVISSFQEKPLIWNVFPFHPHNVENVLSNRTPTKTELQEGKGYLLELLELFDIQKIIALGRKPESQIEDIRIEKVYVRHPANGGQKKCIEGLKKEMIF